jgi:hypothetical protein
VRSVLHSRLGLLDGRFDCSYSFGQASGVNLNDFKAEVAIRIFVDPLKTQGLLKTDPPRLGRRNKAEILNTEYALLIDRIRLDALQLAGERAGDRVPKIGGQSGGAEGRPVVELNLIRLAQCANLALPLQVRD